VKQDYVGPLSLWEGHKWLKMQWLHVTLVSGCRMCISDEMYVIEAVYHQTVVIERSFTRVKRANVCIQNSGSSVGRLIFFSG
jgi:hypothetical protein